LYDFYGAFGGKCTAYKFRDGWWGTSNLNIGPLDIIQDGKTVGGHFDAWDSIDNGVGCGWPGCILYSGTYRIVNGAAQLSCKVHDSREGDDTYDRVFTINAPFGPSSAVSMQQCLARILP
jgi:hypothetical protein